MNPFTNCKIIGDGVNYDQYAKQPDGVKRGNKAFFMSRGELMDFAACPSKWLKGFQDKGGKGQDWGDLLDSLVLAPAKTEMRFVVAPEKYPDGKGGEKDWTYRAGYCADWKEKQESNGLKVVSSGDMKKATSALESLKLDADIMELIDCSKTQVMVTGEYKDKATGIVVPLKGLLDLVPDVKHAEWGKCLADFKTASCAAVFEFGRAITNHHYDAQAFLYKSLYEAATGEDRATWTWAVQESDEPFQPEIYSASEYFLENGSTKILNALKLYCWCLANNKWPSYRSFARLQYGKHSIIEPEAWTIASLAGFCKIPENEQPKPQSEGEVVP